MQTILNKIFFLIIFFIFPKFIYPCYVPLPGQFTSTDKIIDNSRTILLVKMTKSNRLKIIEVLKGDSDLINLNYSYYQPNGTYLNEIMKEDFHGHFNNHTDSNFWTDVSVGRSPFPCCVCGPIHTFNVENEYLIFPDQMGSMKSAEFIPTKEDKWYKYVKEKTRKKK